MFIGIVIRTGFFQDLPFDPIVWKFIADEQIDGQDNLMADPSLENFLERVKSAHIQTEWVCLNWNESNCCISCSSEVGKCISENNYSEYRKLVIFKRIDSLKHALEKIRDILINNLFYLVNCFQSWHKEIRLFLSSNSEMLLL